MIIFLVVHTLSNHPVISHTLVIVDPLLVHSHCPRHQSFLSLSLTLRCPISSTIISALCKKCSMLLVKKAHYVLLSTLTLLMNYCCSTPHHTHLSLPAKTGIAIHNTTVPSPKPIYPPSRQNIPSPLQYHHHHQHLKPHYISI